MIGTYLRCLDCAVAWTGADEPCWSCGAKGINPLIDPAAMLTARWPSPASPYTESHYGEMP